MCFIFVVRATISFCFTTNYCRNITISFAKISAMKSNSTKYTPRGGYEDRRRMHPGCETPIVPIINWVALWSRIWLFLKRLVAELWYLVSRRQGSKQVAPSHHRQQAGPGLVLFRMWSVPLFKVAAALVLFFYVMPRDI